jgi:hypothetical protein
MFGLFIGVACFGAGALLLVLAAFGEDSWWVFVIVGVFSWLVGAAALRLWWITFTVRVDNALQRSRLAQGR